jgi:flagellar basal-body rod modification protein FlgD
MPPPDRAAMSRLEQPITWGGEPMYAAGVSSTTTYANQPNSRVVTNPDPSNPVIADASETTDSQSFMKLVIEQLKNQDPMDPMKSQEFTSQLAQINSLEQLISLNQNMSTFISGGRLGDATALIGHYVEGIDANSTPVTGVVESVEVVEGEPTLRIGDKMLLLDQVATVTAAKDATDSTDGGTK